MSHLTHSQPDYLKAWRQIGLKQTLGPEISRGRRACLPLRAAWRWASAALRVEAVPLRVVTRKRA